MTLETIFVRVEVDRAAAIRAGKNQYGEVTVPVPATLTPEQRETLLSLPYQSEGHRDYAYKLLGKSISGPYSNDKVSLPAISEASNENIAMLLDAYPAALAAYRESKRQEANERVREDIVAGKFDRYSIDTLLKFADPELAEEYQTLRKQHHNAAEVETQRREQQRKEENARLRSIEEARAVQKEAETKAWIDEHGSKRLRRLLAEDIEHDGVYRDERLALDRPDWQWDDGPENWQEPRNPPETALDLLDEARFSEKNAKLRYYRVEVEREDSYDPDAPYEAEDEIEHGYTCTAQFLGRGVIYKKRVYI